MKEDREPEVAELLEEEEQKTNRKKTCSVVSAKVGMYFGSACLNLWGG